jgi:pimeloyl-ACP methyl ester carboxylesterase
MFSLHQRFPAAIPGAVRRANKHRISTKLSLAGEALAGFDWLALRLSGVFTGAGVPCGDGTAVVLVPGMLASNASMLELLEWLRRIGYRTYFADMQRNDACPEETLDWVLAAVERAYEATGRRVHIIGHSLGGLVARGAAMARPDRVARVITLGTPVNGVRVHPVVALGGAMFMRAGCDGSCVDVLQRPLPTSVRETSIYSKHDGIVEWETCVRSGTHAIEVHCSHIGLIASADAYRAIARTLATPAAATPRAVASQQDRGGALAAAYRTTANRRAA